MKPLFPLALPLLLLSNLAWALTADEIVDKANLTSFYSGQDGRSQARMLIVDGQGRKQSRQFTILRRTLEQGGDQQMLVHFSRPSDVRGTVFRVEKHPQSLDDRWLYLPGLDLLKRISSGDKRTSFVGSHFFYEDVSGRSLKEDNFTLLEETDSHYLIAATPKHPAEVEFSRYQVWIDKQSWLPSIVRYFNDQDQAYRQVETVKVETVDGYPTVVRSKVSDLKSGGYTLMELRGVQYNLGLPDTLFTEQSMRQVPNEFLK
ncbi:outer membrane lipoprotein-sorting protein [Ferrimonas aestuarii]|uniref:Outer membrane lipoprotein-sorting protein n=1 Tax=Ferrimonas aestuarii TaxID=2569539 RepID=A0A4V5NWG5_9GAMM|nr:outer membrane lipoprotein-sorting protein [Ferrimonas aestuarii]TKB55528.1 outer membrane lipoprotein-sorting protein [Ferrimonas aestuarii]